MNNPGCYAQQGLTYSLSVRYFLYVPSPSCPFSLTTFRRWTEKTSATVSGTAVKMIWVTNIPTEYRQYPYSVKFQYVSRLPHLFPASRAVYANEVCFILRSILTVGYEDLNYVENLNMVYDSPRGNDSRQIDARLRRQMLKKYAIQRPRRPGEEMRVSSVALTNPD